MKNKWKFYNENLHIKVFGNLVWFVSQAQNHLLETCELPKKEDPMISIVGGT